MADPTRSPMVSYVPPRTEVTATQSCRSTTGKVVLVTGTAGFIGFHCATALKKRGDGVIGIDNFNSYYPASFKRARASELEKVAGVLTIDADLNDAETLAKIMKEHKITHVLALA